MSNEALTWAFKQDLPMAEKFVLVALADYADEDGACFPAHGKTAKRIGGSVITVKRAVKSLAEKGYLRIVERKRDNKSQTSNRYYLNLNRPDDGGITEIPPAGMPTDTPLTTITNHHICYEDSAESPTGATTGQAPSRNSPGPKRDKWGVLESDRRPVRDAIMKAAQEKYGTGVYYHLFEDFLTALAHYYGEDIAAYAENKWTIHPGAATPEGAGKELNTLISTAITVEGLNPPRVA